MSTDSSNFLDAALSLPDDQRASLAFQLLQSLKPPGVLNEEDAHFNSELLRRVKDVEDGKARVSDWDDVARRLRDALHEKRTS